MKITSKGEYAAKAVLYLALKDPEIVTIQEIAEQHNIPLKYLEHILCTLKHAGVLRSRRGIHGGYQLGRPPTDITLGEVLRIVDGDFAGGRCPEGADPAVMTSGYVCPELNSCGLQMVWNEVRHAVESILDHTTFDDIRKRTLSSMTRKSDFMRYEV
jgi:Rrf2 family protein